MDSERARTRALARLQAEHRACRLCVEHGYIARAHPVFSGTARQRILLVGQAPGIVEEDETRPFAGRAGKQLMRWLMRAGFRDEDDVRARVYMTAMSTCFPGRRTLGGGDRRPSAREVALCARWLDGVLRVLQPKLILPVGSLALTRFLPGRNLDDVIGHAFSGAGGRVDTPPAQGPVLLPLPHPSGQSRWLNEPRRAALLGQALHQLGELVVWAEKSPSLAGIGAGAMV